MISVLWSVPNYCKNQFLFTHLARLFEGRAAQFLYTGKHNKHESENICMPPLRFVPGNPEFVLSKTLWVLHHAATVLYIILYNTFHRLSHYNRKQIRNCNWHYQKWKDRIFFCTQRKKTTFIGVRYQKLRGRSPVREKLDRSEEIGVINHSRSYIGLRGRRRRG